MHQVFVDLLAPVARVQLVHGHDQPLEAQRADQLQVLLGLAAAVEAGLEVRDVRDEERRVGLHRALQHVGHEVAMARRVQDGEAPGLGVEVLDAHVDRDSPRSLVLALVQHPREREGGLADMLRLLLELVQLLGRDVADQAEEVAHQRRLPGIDVADHDQADVRPLVVRRGVGGRRGDLLLLLGSSRLFWRRRRGSGLRLRPCLRLELRPRLRLRLALGLGLGRGGEARQGVGVCVLRRLRLLRGLRLRLRVAPLRLPAPGVDLLAEQREEGVLGWPPRGARAQRTLDALSAHVRT
mmetsp:Transcript_50500/g.130090  ORF Transcript_50500/g.130090 Transcript_50500/m.130090 type:complete len:296 (-) Transcript_50500:85-972(-)